METQKTCKSQNDPEKEEQIKTVWYWDKSRQINQWSRIDNPRINLHTYGLSIYAKEGKNIPKKKKMGKRVSSISSAWKTGQLHAKRMKLEHFLTLCTKINSKWVKDLNVRPETIKPLEENIARLLCDINCSNVFLDLFPKVKEIKAKISKWNLNLKAFAQQRKP